MQQRQVNRHDAAKTKSACIKRDFLQEEWRVRSNVVLDSIRWQEKDNTAHSLPYLPAAWGSDAVMPRYLLKGEVYPRLTCWLPPHQGDCRNCCPVQFQRVQRAQEGRSPGRVALAPPKQQLQLSNLGSLGSPHSKHCPPPLPIASRASQAKGGELGVFSNHSSLTKFHQKKNDRQPLHLKDLLFYFARVAPNFKSCSVSSGKTSIKWSWCYWDFLTKEWHAVSMSRAP